MGAYLIQQYCAQVNSLKIQQRHRRRPDAHSRRAGVRRRLIAPPDPARANRPVLLLLLVAAPAAPRRVERPRDANDRGVARLNDPRALVRERQADDRPTLLRDGVEAEDGGEGCIRDAEDDVAVGRKCVQIIGAAGAVLCAGGQTDYARDGAIVVLSIVLPRVLREVGIPSILH